MYYACILGCRCRGRLAVLGVVEPHRHERQPAADAESLGEDSWNRLLFAIIQL